MINMYTSAISRYYDYGKKYGDAVPWNNQIWTVVRAENAINALNTAYKFWIKSIEVEKERIENAEEDCQKDSEE